MANERITEHSSEQKENAESSYSIDALAERKQDEFCSPLSDISNDLLRSRSLPRISASNWLVSLPNWFLKLLLMASWILKNSASC